MGVAADATVNATRDLLTRNVDLQLLGRRCIAQLQIVLLVVLEQVVGVEECAAFTLKGVTVLNGVIAQRGDRAEDGVAKASRRCHNGGVIDD